MGTADRAYNRAYTAEQQNTQSGSDLIASVGTATTDMDLGELPF